MKWLKAVSVVVTLFGISVLAGVVERCLGVPYDRSLLTVILIYVLILCYR